MSPAASAPYTPPPRALYWLLATLFAVTAPHMLRLSPPMALVTLGIAGGWLLAVWRTGKPLRVHKWVRVGLVLLTMLLIAIDHGRILGRVSGVAFLVGLTHLKLLEFKDRRDYLIVILLCCFLVMTHFFYGQSIPMALYALAVTLSIIVNLNLLFHPDASPLVLIRRAALLLLHALPVMLVLFVLFPRLQNPMWSLPRDTIARQGLSDSMTPGSVSRLIRSGGVAFRVRFNWNAPDLKEMYWRGPVLWLLDGETWRGLPKDTPVHRVRWRGTGKPTSYVVTLEPHGRPWLFALDLPTTLPKGAWLQTDFQLLTRHPVDRTRRYGVISHLNYFAAPTLRPLNRRLALQLPPMGNPRARALAHRWAEQAVEGREVVQWALQRFRREPFVYTLSPPLLGRDPVDEFLFGSRRGFCEHFAGAFTFLMRAAGIPARVVTGYQGGEWNPQGDHLTVRQADAHAWSEVWLPDDGWVRVDPTAAVAPERVERGLAAAVPVGEPLPLLIDPDNSMLRRVWQTWDNIDNRWNQWVLGYDSRRQMAFLQALGWRGVSHRGMTLGLIAGMALFFALLAGYLLWSGRGRDLDPVRRLYNRFCANLAKRGVVRRPGEGPMDFAHRAMAAHPGVATPIREATRFYIALRYLPDPPAEGLNLLKKWVRTLERQKSR